MQTNPVVEQSYRQTESTEITKHALRGCLQ